MIIRSLQHLRYIVDRFKKYPWVAYDTETVGKSQTDFSLTGEALIHGRAEIIAFSLCHKGEAYCGFTQRYSRAYPFMTEWFEVLRELWDDPNIVKVCHNLKYDTNVTLEHYSELPSNAWDTVFGCWIADVNREKDLKSRAAKLGRLLSQTKTVPFDDPERLAEYAEEDTIATDEIYQVQLFGATLRRPPVISWVDWNGNIISKPNPFPQLETTVESETIDEFSKIFIQLQEMPVLKAAIRAEAKGMLYDQVNSKDCEWQALMDCNAAKKKIFRLADKVFNINSPKQLLEVFDELGVEVKSKTKKGDPSVNAESLFYLTEEHPIVNEIIAYRQASKLLSTYLSKNGLVYYVNPKTQRIHTSLNTTGARTGRFSCTRPNLQTIPSQKDIYGIKKLFIAPPGRKIICLDYCLHPDTEVDVVGVGKIPIKQVKAGDKLFALDEKTGKPTFTTVKRSVPIPPLEAYRTKFDNGSEVISSEDHKWPTRVTGNKLIRKTTSNLQAGDRMVPLRRNHASGYCHLYSYGAFKYAKEHLVVAEAYYGPRKQGFHTHHIDGDKTNNAKENLHYVRRRQHLSMHGREKYQTQDHTLRLKNLRKAVKHNRRSYTGKGNPNYGFRKGPDIECQHCGDTFYKAPCYKAKYCSPKCYRAAKVEVGFNHKVVSNEYIGEQPMWAIEVDKDHNYFLANGVLTYNSQIEIRVMAIFSKDVLMTEVLNDPHGDIHTTTAREFGVNRSPQAKYCNFNLQYGGGGFMLAKILTLAGAPTDASTGDMYKRNYDATYPGVSAFRKQMYAFHNAEGYFPMLCGRKVSVKNLDSKSWRLRHKAETQLANNVIQGCSSKNTKVVVDNLGELTILEFMQKYKTHKLNSKIWTGDSWEKVTDVFSVGKKPLWKVTLSDGTVHEVSNTHLWKNENDAWVMTQDLQVGDYLQQSIAKRLKVFNVKNFLKVTAAEAEVVGYMVGDGTYSIDRPSLVAKKDPSINIHQWDVLCRAFGDRVSDGRLWQKPKFIFKVGAQPRLRELGLTAWHQVGEFEYKSFRHQKIFPKWLFSQTTKIQQAFIRGYYLTDGGTSGRSVMFTSVSESLIKGTQRLLYQLGIASIYRNHKPKNKSHHLVHRIFVVGLDQRKLYDIVKHVDCGKVRKLEEVSRSSETNKGDALPPELAQRVAFEWESTLPRYGNKIAWGNDRNASAMMSKLKKGKGSACYALTLPVTEETKRLLGYRYLQVVSVEDCEEEVEMYDMTVEPSHQYTLANGVVCHNSAQDLLKASIVRNDPYCINPDREAVKRLSFEDSAYADRLNEYATKLDRYRELYVAANLDWLLQVHDEVIFEVDADLAEEVGNAIADVMTWYPYFESVTELSVPIRVDGGIADNWYTAKGDDAEIKIER